MKFLLPSLLTGLMLLAIYVGYTADTASAYSPDIRPVATGVAIIEEDEGYYNDPIVSVRGHTADTFPNTILVDSPRAYAATLPAHATAPGADTARVQLLHDLNQSPEQYLESLRAAEEERDEDKDGEGEGEEAQAPGSVMELPWVADGQTDDEKLALDFLSELAGFDQEAAERVAVMPFLQTFGPADVEALWSLTYLAEYDAEEETTTLTDVLDNPHLADDGGIDDEEAKVVAVLGGANYFNPDLAPVLLDPAERTVIERRIQGRSREILMTIIRTDHGSDSTFDLLEFAVKRAEITMAKPLRTNYVALLIADDALPDFAAGAHFGTHMAMPPRFDVDDRSEYPGDWAGFLIAHEVAHYYWFHDTELWVDEGSADFMANVNEYHRVGRAMEPDNVPCPFYQSLLHLELAQPELSSYGGLCHYSQGERMLLDLHDTIGKASFFQGFRAFHDGFEPEGSEEIPAVDHLTGAFLPNGLSGAQKTIRELLLSRHYGAILDTDTGAVDPAIAALNSEVADVYLVRMQDGEIVERLSGFPRISASQLVGRYVFALDIPLAEPLEEETEVEYEFVEYYQDGFILDRTVTTETYPAGYEGGLTALGGIGFIPNFKWPTGLYWFYVYQDGRKIAEMYLDVTP